MPHNVGASESVPYTFFFTRRVSGFTVYTLTNVLSILCISAVLSSLGSTATGQFGSLGVSWNYGAPSISSNVPPPLPPSQFSAPGEQVTAQQHEERNQTPDDDLGLSYTSVLYMYMWYNKIQW